MDEPNIVMMADGRIFEFPAIRGPLGTIVGCTFDEASFESLRHQWPLEIALTRKWIN